MFKNSIITRWFLLEKIKKYGMKSKIQLYIRSHYMDKEKCVNRGFKDLLTLNFH